MRVCVVLMFCMAFAASRRVYDANRNWYQELGNPGIKVRLTEAGMEELRVVAISILNEEIPKIAGLSANGGFGQGTVEVTNIKVTRWKGPEFSLLRTQPPNKIVLGMENADLGLDADFVAKQDPFELPGTITGEAKGITLAVTMSMFENAGGVRMTSDSCKAVVRRSTFEVEPDESPIKGLVTGHLPAINNALRAFLPTVFCEAIGRALNQVGQKILNSDRLLVNVGDGETVVAGAERVNLVPPEAEGTADALANHFLDDMVIDARLMRDPVSSYEFFETHHKGEVFYRTSVIRTPFTARPMPPIPKTEKMICIQASEWVINAMLYHAYLNDKLNLKFNEADVPANFAKFLKTSCGSLDGGLPDKFEDNIFDKVCLGSLIPSLNAEYPNKVLELEFLPHGLPEFVLRNGIGLINLNGRILAYVTTDEGVRKQVLVTNAQTQSDVKMQVEDGRIFGDMKLNKMDLTVHRSSLAQLNPDNVEQLSPVAKQIFAPELSKLLQKGFPIPLSDMMELTNEEVIMDDGYMMVCGDLDINEAALQEEINAQLQQGLTGLT